MFKDPVCGMNVERNRFSIVHAAQVYYFCSHGCRIKFKKNPEDYSKKQKYDLIIIGAGPAGLTAGVYASILKIDTLLLSTDMGGQAVDSTKIKNYMGYDFITGPELAKKFQDQLLHEHYIDHKVDSVVSIRKSKNSFSIKTQSGHLYKSKALIVATGMVRNKLRVPGENKFIRKGICYSAGQDIPLLAGKKVAVVGGGNSALQIVLALSKHECEILNISIEPWTADPNLCEEVRAIKNLEVYDHHAVMKIKGKENVERIFLKNLLTQEKLESDVETVFVAIGSSPNSSLLKHLVDLNEKSEIEVNPDCSTKIPGLFAAGDVTNVFAKRIIIASGEGAKAALAANQYLTRSKN